MATNKTLKSTKLTISKSALSRELVDLVVSFDQSLALLGPATGAGNMSFQEYSEPLLGKIKKFKRRLNLSDTKLRPLSGVFVTKYAEFLQGVHKAKFTPQQYLLEDRELFELSNKIKRTPEERELLDA